MRLPRSRNEIAIEPPLSLLVTANYKPSHCVQRRIFLISASIECSVGAVGQTYLTCKTLHSLVRMDRIDL